MPANLQPRGFSLEKACDRVLMDAVAAVQPLIAVPADGAASIFPPSSKIN
jgi:hypothetical protein